MKKIELTVMMRGKRRRKGRKGELFFVVLHIFSRVWLPYILLFQGVREELHA